MILIPRSAILIAGIVGIGIVASPALAQLPSYELVEIPRLAGPSIGGAATGINDLEQVTGFSNGQVFLWTEQDGTIDLQLGLTSAPGVETGTPRFARINSASDVVAYIEASGQEFIPYLLSGGEFQRLEPVSGTAGSQAFDINDSGIVVGSAFNFFGDQPGAIWRSPTSDPIAIDAVLTIRAISDTTFITGRTVGDTAFLAEPGNARILPVPAEFETAVGRDVDDLGRVVGEVERPETSGGNPVTLSRPYVWNPDGTSAELPLPADAPIGFFVEVNAANEEGIVVGNARQIVFDPDSFGLIWNLESGETDELDDLVVNLAGRSIEDAHDINDDGTIAVTIELSNGDRTPGILRSLR